MNYEINFLVLQSKTVELPALRLKVKELISSLGGKVTEEKEYAKRKLAYKIKKESYGFHTVLRFEMEDRDKLAEMKKALNLEEKISRYLVVKADELLSLSELEEKLKKASEEKTHLSQEELGKFLKEKKDLPSKPAVSSIPEEKPILNQEEKIQPKQELPAEEKLAEKTPEGKEETPVSEESEKKEPTRKKDQVSMDELDKKLDEILNI